MMTGVGRKRHARLRQILYAGIIKKGFIKEYPSINGYFVQSLRYAQVLLLEILQYIPLVKIFSCVDNELPGTHSAGVGLSTRRGVKPNISFLDGH